MSYQKKRLFRTVTDIALELIGLAILTLFLWNLQMNAAVRQQESNSLTKLHIAQQRLEQNAREAEENLASFDEFNQAKVDTIAYAYTQKELSLPAFCEQWGLSSYYVLDSSQTVLASNVLPKKREVGLFSELLETMQPVTLQDGRRYYAAYVDNGGVLICGRDFEKESLLLKRLCSPAYALQSIKAGITGYVYAVNKGDGTFAYHPDDTLIGMDAASYGFDPALYPDGYSCWSILGGKRFFCLSSATENYFLVSAVPESELMANAGRCTCLSVLIFAIVVSLIVVYALILRCDQDAHSVQSADYLKIGKLYLNRTIERKLRNVALLGLILVFVATSYNNN